MSSFDQEGREIYIRIRDCIKNYIDEIISVRRDLHAYPELAFEETRTSDVIARLLEKWGYEVTRGIGQTGLVGKLKNGTSQQSIGIRAEIDALPVREENNLISYKSQHDGIMHASGNDGHIAILLAAARYLAKTKNFNGTVNLIFQPAKEQFVGAIAMIKDGLFRKFPCDEIYGLNNYSPKKEKIIYICNGNCMAATDRAKITIYNCNYLHGMCVKPTDEPITVASNIITNIQAFLTNKSTPSNIVKFMFDDFIVKNKIDKINATAEIHLTIRTYDTSTQKRFKESLENIVNHVSVAHNSEAEIEYEYVCPALINSQDEIDNIKKLLISIFGSEKVKDCQPLIAADDFSVMLSYIRNGAYLFLGTGECVPTGMPNFDFNDKLILTGATLWSALVENRLPYTWAEK
ncbi:MAG: Amidohydrolase [Candidatus Tokpelaia sp. JSC188]|nr:MAG: Amidohydrolase [Candidatus Tokpelaia sp. JSC188]